ncbi:MAG: DinB family protein [Anaerolinea sp.]|nr:DinB family protein [Anaerolinea sp.]
MLTILKPQPNEYGAYYLTYISLVPDDGQLLQHMKYGLPAVREAVASIPAAWLTKPFAEGEWTVHEILVHMIDAERIFAYRALRIGRGDTTPLPGFDQDPYVPLSRANERSLASILAEYEAVRAASLTLFESFSAEDYLRLGTASNNPASVRALGYMLVGHEQHHLKSLRANYVGRQG